MQTDSASERKPSLNAVRAPVMLIYILAIVAAHGTNLPVWGSLLISACIFGSLGILLDRRATNGQIKTNLRGIMLSTSLALVLYVLMKSVLEIWVHLAGAALGDVTVPISMLLMIRAHIDELSPLIVGIAGGLLLVPAEELFWHGFIQRKLVLRLGVPLGIGIGAVLFGGFYALLISPLVGVAAGLVGLVFGVYVHRQQDLVSATVGRALLWLMGIYIIPLY